MSFDCLTNPWRFLYRTPKRPANMAKEGEESKPLGSYPDSGINVLIVGTGLAGLTCAIESIRKGHKVQVLERDSAINTAGMQRTIIGGDEAIMLILFKVTCTSWVLAQHSSSSTGLR